MGEAFSLTLIAIYNSPTTFEASTFIQTTNIPSGPIILCGDFNLHAPDWDDMVYRVDNQTSLFQDWLMAESFQVLNDPSKPTFHGHKFQHAKVDDLVMANAEVFRNYDIGPVQVHDEHHFGSDHYPISFEIYTNEVPPPPQHHYTFSEDHREDWVCAITPIFNEIMKSCPPVATPDSLDQLAAAIISAIKNATQQTMKKSRTHSHHAKHWWNDDLDHALIQLRIQAEGVKTTHGNPILVRQYEEMKGAFHAKVRHAKRTWATKRLEGATSHTVWEFIKWYKHGGK